MRKPEYLSPSAIEKFFNPPDQEEYYLRYLADNRPPKMPQTDAMSVGSSFDAYVKAELCKDLFGTPPEGFDLATLFETQVEPQNRDFALVAGAVCMKAYKESGAYMRLMAQLRKASKPPRFEFSARGLVNGVPVMGKPDLQYCNDIGADVIVDWKVNGYCSKSGASPKKGYVLCMDGWHGKQSRTHNKVHKDCHLFKLGGTLINIGCFFEEVDVRWARQLVTYGWLGGEEIGSNFVIQIEQLACKQGGHQIRCATHAGRASKQFQEETAEQYRIAWKAIQEGHIFINLSYEESVAKQRSLDLVHKAFQGTTDNDQWFRDMHGK